MNKTLLAFLLATGIAGTVHAQTGVTIYGMVDTGFIRESGSDVRMGGNEDSMIGFRGTEELGSGMKATFRHESDIPA